MAGSKFEGTGLENEQIVQTHVALLGLGVPGPDPAFEKGLLPRFIGEVLELRKGEPVICAFEKVDWLRLEMYDGLAAFGYKVTLDEDLRKPACRILVIC